MEYRDLLLSMHGITYLQRFMHGLEGQVEEQWLRLVVGTHDGLGAFCVQVLWTSKYETEFECNNQMAAKTEGIGVHSRLSVTKAQSFPRTTTSSY